MAFVRTVSLALLFLAAVPGGAAAAQLRVLVTDLQADPGTQASFFQDVLVQEVARLPGVRVFSMQDLSALMGVERAKTLLDGSVDQKQLADSIAADQLVTGRVTRSGGSQVLTLRVLQTKESKVIGQATMELGADASENIVKIAAAVRMAFGAKGSIRLWGQIKDARVFLDGEPAGVMPIAQIPVRNAGTHKLKIIHDEYPVWEQTVNVDAGADTRVRVGMLSYSELDNRSAARKTWGASLLAAGALALGGGALFYTSAGTLADEYEAERVRRIPASQAEAHRTRLEELRDGADSRTQYASAAGGAGGLLVLAGSYLLLFNPWADRLEASNVTLAPSSIPSGASLLVNVRWGE